MNYPRLRFKSFQGNWTIETMKDVANKITDGTHDTPKTVETGIPYLTAIHIKNSGIDYANCYFLTQEEHQKIYRRCNPERGDILIVNIGAGTSTSAINTVDYEFSLKNVALVKPNKQKIIPEFLLQVQKRNALKQFNELTSGGAQPFLSLKEIGKIKVPLPSLSEQEKIAFFLSTIDQKISLLEKKSELLMEYRKCIIQKIFNQQIRFKDKDGVAFQAWSYLLAGELFQNVSDKNHNSDLPILSATKEYGMFPRSENGIAIISSAKTVSSYKVVKKGDYVISLMSYQSGLEYSEYDGITSPVYIVIRPVKEISDYFYKALFKKDDFIFQLSEIAVGIRQGRQISFSAFAALNLPYPSIAEQNKISALLLTIDKKEKNLSRELELTRQYKKGLLQKMFI